MRVFPSSWSSQHLLSVGCGGNPIRALSQHGEVLRGSVVQCLGASASNEGCKMRGLLFTHSGWRTPSRPSSFSHQSIPPSVSSVPNSHHQVTPCLWEPNLEHYPKYSDPSIFWQLMIVSASYLQFLKWCVPPLFLKTAAVTLNPPPCSCCQCGCRRTNKILQL